MAKHANASETVQPQMRMVTPENQAKGGEAPRTDATKRENQTSTQPENAVMAATGSEENTAALADAIPIQGKGRKASFLNGIAKESIAAAHDKLEHMREARQKLAQAADLVKEGDSKSEEARSVAAEGAALLYRDRANGNISADQVSAIMGDTFGYKAKKDGTPSKTPNGLGEHLRKRIVRAVQGWQYINGDPDADVSTFYRGLDKDEVQDILHRLNNGQIGIWQAYDDLAELKKNGSSGRIPAAFDVKAVAKMVSQLLESEAPAKLLDTPGLGAAYAELQRAIAVVDERATELMDERDAA